MRAHQIKQGRRATSPTVSARLSGHVTLEAQANEQIFACFDGYSVGLGTFSAGAMDRARDLRIGLPLASFVSGRRNIDKEIHLLVRRLARHGLLEYRLRRSRNDENQVVIEPQVADYWPAMPQLDNADVLVLSRFAYMRRRGNDIVLESPRAGALFKLCNPTIAMAIAMLSTPQRNKRLRRQDCFPGLELLALLVGSQILLKIDAGDRGLQPTAEDDHNLVLGTFTIFCPHAQHERPTRDPVGRTYPCAGVTPPPPAVRPRWPGKRIDAQSSRPRIR